MLVVKGAVPGPNGGYVARAEGEEVTAMPTVDVVDLNNQEVGALDLADEVFGAEVNEALLYEAVRHYPAGERARHAQDQGAPRSGGLRQEALEAEGHRPRARRFGSLAALAPRRHGARTGAARLQLQAAAQDAAWARCARRFRPKFATAN